MHNWVVPTPEPNVWRLMTALGGEEFVNVMDDGSTAGYALIVLRRRLHHHGSPPDGRALSEEILNHVEVRRAKVGDTKPMVEILWN